MLRVIDTGEIAYVYAPPDCSKEFVSALPLHVATEDRSMSKPPESYRDSFIAQKESPLLRKLAVRNSKILNQSEYMDENLFKLAVQRSLEVLPGPKSVLFFGGDFTDLFQLDATIQAAGELEHKTWVIKVGNTELLNSYWLNLQMSGDGIPENVWLYATDVDPEVKLHWFPTWTYEEAKEGPVLSELEQFPEKYEDFVVKVWKTNQN